MRRAQEISTRFVLAMAIVIGLAVLHRIGQQGNPPSHPSLQRLPIPAGDADPSQLGHRYQVNASQSGASHGSPLNAREESYLAEMEVQDGEGSPVCDLTLRWFSRTAKGPAFHGMATTDQLGRFAVAMKSPGPISIELQSEQWFLPREHVLPKDRSTLVLRAIPCIKIRILALCDSGASFVGRGRVYELVGAGRAPRFYRELKFEDGQVIELAGVPEPCDLVVVLDESMLGYEEYKQVFLRDQLMEGDTIKLTVPHGAQEKGQIEVDLSGCPATFETIEVRALGAKCAEANGGSGSLDPQRHWRCRPIPAGEYLVRVSGGVFWESQRVVVRSGEISYVKYIAYAPAEIGVLVLDEKGAPIEGAVLTRETEGYFKWDAIHARVSRGWLALTGSNGRAKLDALPQGKLMFLVEAEGYEPEFAEVELAEGCVHDAGAIQLRRASGRIVVRLKGMRSNYHYNVLVLQPGGNEVNAVMQTTQKEFVFERMPSRPYVVGVYAGMGGKTASAYATPSSDSNDVVLELDVSELEESADRR